MARRFDYLMYSIELAMLEQKNPSKNIGAVVGIAEKLSLMQDSVPQTKSKNIFWIRIQTRILGKSIYSGNGCSQEST